MGVYDAIVRNESPRLEGRRELPIIPSLQKPLCVSSDGFGLEAGVRIRKGDREGSDALSPYRVD